MFASPHQDTPHWAAEVGLLEKANLHSEDLFGVSECGCNTDCGLILLIRVSLVPIHLTRVWYTLVQLITSILSEKEIANWSSITAPQYTHKWLVLQVAEWLTAHYQGSREEPNMS